MLAAGTAHFSRVFSHATVKSTGVISGGSHGRLPAPLGSTWFHFSHTCFRSETQAELPASAPCDRVRPRRRPSRRVGCSLLGRCTHVLPARILELVKHPSLLALCLATASACGGSGSAGTGTGGSVSGGGGTPASGGSSGLGGGASGGSAGSAGSSAGGTGGGCLLSVGSYGSYLLTFSTPLAQAKPILFHADVVVDPKLLFSLTPLDAHDRKTVVGTPTGVYADATSDGKFTLTVSAFDIPGAANPFSSADIVADVTLSGQLCGLQDFYCGIGGGNLVTPFAATLAGSTWTLEKYPANATPPSPPLIDCSKTPAGPAP